MGRGRMTLTLEEYERFLQNPNDVDFSIAQLNQIIFMHGFKRVHRQRKGVVFEALRTIDLMKPQRSTIQEKLHPYDSSLSLEQVKQDLEALNWQECHVHSIVTISSGQSDGCDDLSKDLEVSSFNVNRKRRSLKRKRRAMKCIIRDSSAADVSGVGNGSPATGEEVGAGAA